MQDKKPQLEPDMEQRTGSKLGKEYVKAVLSREVWRASVHGVTKSQTRLRDQTITTTGEGRLKRKRCELKVEGRR